MTNKSILKKAKFDFSEDHYVNISDECKTDASDLLDGYQAYNGTQKKIISWDNAHTAVDRLIGQNILNFKKKRTRERKVVKNILYTLLEDTLRITDVYKQNCFILNNQDKFASIIQNTAQKYKDWRDKKQLSPDNIISYPWETPSDYEYNTEMYEKYDAKKYIYNPCYLRKDRLDPERRFEKFIDNSDLIKCWYKNRDNGKEHFGIPYKYNKESHTFYPDFVCELHDDNVAIFDTKAGQTEKLAKEKAKALNKYCVNNKIKGGIIRRDGTIWKINCGKNYDHNNNSQWKEFDKIFKI